MQYDSSLRLQNTATPGVNFIMSPVRGLMYGDEPSLIFKETRSWSRWLLNIHPPPDTALDIPTYFGSLHFLLALCTLFTSFTYPCLLL
jgi:hypothetical protein